jgi:type VI secretion system protein ImpK
MSRALSEAMAQVIATTLELHEAWLQRVEPALETGRERLRQAFRIVHRLAPPLEPNRGAGTDADLLDAASPSPPTTDDLGVSYPLVCWVDELLTQHPRIGAAWNDRKLEAEFHGTNDRAWRFWKQARGASERNDVTQLRLCFDCVGLGFRGELVDDSARVSEWLIATHDQLIRSGLPAWVAPPRSNPAGPARPLQGRKSLHATLRWAIIAAGFLFVVGAWLVIRQLTR